MIFIQIHRVIRAKFGLNPSDAMLAQYIHIMCTTETGSSYAGWCYASRPTMAKELIMTERNIVNMIRNLESLGLVKINSKRHLKTTKKYRDALRESLEIGEYFYDDLIEKRRAKKQGKKGVKKFQGGEKISGVKKFPKRGEKISGGGVKKFHPIIQVDIKQDTKQERERAHAPEDSSFSVKNLSKESLLNSSHSQEDTAGQCLNIGYDAILFIKQVVLLNSQQVEAWKMKFPLFRSMSDEEVDMLVDDFADWYFKDLKMPDNQVLDWLKANQSKIPSSFSTSWLRNLGKEKQKNNGTNQQTGRRRLTANHAGRKSNEDYAQKWD